MTTVVAKVFINNINSCGTIATVTEMGEMSNIAGRGGVHVLISISSSSPRFLLFSKLVLSGVTALFIKQQEKRDIGSVS